MTSTTLDHTAPLILIIDPDPAARTLVAAVARQLGNDIAEAGDAISGLDLAAQHAPRLRLAVLDVHLPEIDGYDVCLRLRDIGLQHGNLFPVLPYTAPGVMEMLLDEIGCERPCFKPATSHQLEATLRRAFDAPRRHLARTPLLTFSRQRAVRAEQAVRQEQAGNLALLSRSLPVRLGLHQLLTSAGGRVIAESSSSEQLDQLLAMRSVHTLVADAADRYDAAQLALHHRVALLLIATTAEHVALLAKDVPALEQVHGLIAALDERAPLIISAALSSLRQGRHFFHLPLEQLGQARDKPIPHVIERLMRDAQLTRREREVLWLDAQGLSDPQIAERLRVSQGAVNTYWKRAQQKLGLARPQAKDWLRRLIDQSSEGGQGTRERALGDSENSE